VSARRREPHGTPPGRRTGERAAGGRASSGAVNPRVFLVLVLALVLAGAGVLAYLGGRPKPLVATTVDPKLPPAQAKGYTLGRPDAPVRILEFADFECPACGNYSVVTEPDVRKRVIEPGLARVTYYDFPLPQHKNTLMASEAAACANDQGKFWEMHDLLFQGQTEWNTEATSDPESVMAGYAKKLGLNVDAWKQCVERQAHAADIAANKAEGERRHVNQTPTFVIGNKMIAGALTDDQIKAYVDSARAQGSTSPATATR
jgi:protein-disulfide isomerase